MDFEGRTHGTPITTSCGESACALILRGIWAESTVTYSLYESNCVAGGWAERYAACCRTLRCTARGNTCSNRCD